MEKDLFSLRDCLGKIEVRFKQAIQLVDDKYVHTNEKAYQIVSQVVKNIKENTHDVNAFIQKMLIFIVGATGAGKSTLINYFASSDDNFVVKNDDGQITTKNTSIAQIGGQQATTLFPNLYKCQYGTFLDCAGDGDTGGIIIQIINSIIKVKIASKVEEVKVILVTPYGALKGTAGYGHSFKMALDKNAQFMGDINYLKNNIGIIVTGAITKSSALQNSKNALQNVMKHSDVGPYADIINQVIKNQNLAIFCRPSSQLQIGAIYAPPEWNLNQRQKILQTINNIPYAKVPTKDFFNTSTSPQVRQAMKKGLIIVQAKAGNLILEFVQAAIPLRLFNIQLGCFSKFIKELIIGSQTNFVNYIQILKWNNFLEIQIDQGQIKRINQQIQFLYQFSFKCDKENNNCNLQEKKCLNRDWSLIAKIKNKLNELQTSAQEILNLKQNFFYQSKAQGQISTCSVQPEICSSIQKDTAQLYERYRQLKQIEQLSKQESSKYYKDQIKKQFDRTIQQQYLDQVVSIVDVPYQQWQQPKFQQYTEIQKRKKQVIKMRIQEYQEEKDELKQIIVYKKQHHPVKAVNIPGMVAFNLFSFGIASLVKVIATGDGLYYKDQLKPKHIPYKEYQKITVLVKKTKEVPYLDYEDQQYQVKKQREIQAGKYLTKYRKQQKKQLVTKTHPKHLYKDLKIRVKDQSKIDEDTEGCNDSITKLRQSITANISKYPTGCQKADQKVQRKLTVITKDQYQQKYRDLLYKWLDAEYSAYFSNNPNNSLQQLEIQQICQKVQNIQTKTQK